MGGELPALYPFEAAPNDTATGNDFRGGGDGAAPLSRAVRESTDFSLAMEHALGKLHARWRAERKKGEKGDADAAMLHYYQYLVVHALTNPELGAPRGLLVAHKPGMGKTPLAAAAMLALMSQGLVPIVLAAKSLHDNFRNTVGWVMKALKIPEAKHAGILKALRFATLDAHNMATQVADRASGSLNGRVLIVDEAHNLFRGVINSGSEKTNARRLYDLIMASGDARVLFLTGTPVVKHPFEMVPCFNMLAGYPILPPEYGRFMGLFVNQAEGKLKNRGLLANRLLGFVSWAEPSLPTAPGGRPMTSSPREDGGFPEDLGTRTVEVKMDDDQWGRYEHARDEEERKSAGKKGGPMQAAGPLALPGADREGGGTYHVAVRQISNTGLVGADAVTDAAMDAPKVRWALDRIKKGPAPVMVFSEFVGPGGLAVVEAALRRARVSHTTIRGGMKREDKDAVLRSFNDKANSRGAKTRVMLLSAAGAEGLDLKCVRQVIVFESPWDESRFQQVRARAIRLGSHDALPKKDRDVQVWRLLGVSPEGAPGIDQQMYDNAQRRERLNQDARRLHQEVALECAVHGFPGFDDSIVCRRCQPTGMARFGPDASRDATKPDPCLAVEESEEDADGLLELDGRQFAFKRDKKAKPYGARFFEERADGTWAPLRTGDPIAADLADMV